MLARQAPGSLAMSCQVHNGQRLAHDATLSYLLYTPAYAGDAVRRPLPAKGTPHLLPSSSFAAAVTRSGSNPKCRCSSLSGAEEPNVFMPMTRPAAPTYRSQPKVEASSTATRAFTSGGNTVSRYSFGWWSKISHDGIETTRERMPSGTSVSCAWTARLTSLPEAMRITSGFRPGASASTYAPLPTPAAEAYFLRS